jgi:inner membrane protein
MGLDAVRGLAPLAALAVVAGLDLVMGSRRWPTVVVGVLDEPAHLLTAAIVLAALPAAARLNWPWALAGAVLIDLDHIPLYVWGDAVEGDGGRPGTHSLATVLLLLGLAALLPRGRTALTGLAVGVSLHLVRDVATGPGIPLAWPFPGRAEIPYTWYAAALTLAAVAAAWQWSAPLARSAERRRPNGRERPR